jgi:hypothetical protein
LVFELVSLILLGGFFALGLGGVLSFISMVAGVIRMLNAK